MALALAIICMLRLNMFLGLLSSCLLNIDQGTQCRQGKGAADLLRQPRMVQDESPMMSMLSMGMREVKLSLSMMIVASWLEYA